MAEPIRIVEGDLNGHAGNAIYAEPLGAETLIQLRTTDGQSVTVRHDGGRAVPAEKQAIVIAWDRNDQVLFACDRQRMQSGT